MKVQSKFKRGVLGLLGAALLGSALVMPTLAAESAITQQIIPGTLTAFVADASMTSVSYSNTVGGTTGSLALAVTDARGSSAGWSITLVSTPFIYSGVSPSGINIPNTGFAITATNTPGVTAGQAIGAGGPSAVPAGAASLSVSRTVLQASSGYGSGTYSQALPVSLVIPALSQAGLYTATLTVATVAGP